MSIRNIQEARQTYNIEGWGAGYFGISDRGFAEVYPFGTENVSIELAKIVELAAQQKVPTPLVVRFPQILGTQIARLHKAFRNAMNEAKYQGDMQAVFPFKVNQRKEFITELVKSGHEHRYGLEVGTKAELFAAMSYELHPEALFICNGFKDSRFIELAFDAKLMGKNVVLVIEGTDELKYIIEYAKKVGFCVDIGLRAKLYSKGSGKWEKSSGAESKFGLSSSEIMESLFLIREANLSDKLVMLHYHIGSQITEIKRVKNAMKEAGRVYAKIVKEGYGLKYLNIGGGIGVDYDGSKTSFYASANYTLQEFANDVIYILQDVSKSENCPMPTIVSESGRAVAAYHAVLVTDVREVERMGGNVEEIEISPADHKILGDMMNIYNTITSKNYVEAYHDAIQDRDELFTLFNLGYVELEGRAKAEVIFNEICHKALYYNTISGVQLEEFEEMQKNLCSRYLANFSIFQSIPDSWSIEQLFPVMPLAKLDEKASKTGIIMDITCDSDGCLDKFVDKRDVKSSLELHIPDSDSPYYIGFFLVGAYQEALGNNHNLFGATNEVIVKCTPDGEIEHMESVPGETVGEILRVMNYKDEEVISGYDKQFQKRVDLGKLSAADKDAIMIKIKDYFNEYPYLVVKSRSEIVD